MYRNIFGNICDLFYLCVLISLSGLLPTLIWNYQNNWISFQFHGSRQGFTLNLSNFFIMLFASFLYLLPQIVLLPITNFFRIIKNKNFELITLTPEKILTLLALPNIIFFILVYITSNKTFPHWIMPGWLLLLPIIAKILVIPYSKIKMITFFSSTILIWSLLGVIIFHSQTGILTNYQKELPYWDNTLELINWNPLKKPIDQIIRNFEDGNIKLAAFSWTEAGQLSTLMNNKYEVIVVDGEQHHFRFLRNSNETTPTILLKLSLGLNPDTKTILKRLKKHQEDAYHIKNIVLKRGYRDYATASLFLFNK